MRWAAAILALLLTACFEAPKINANTEAAFSASFAAVTKTLNDADKEKLDAALKDIVLIQVGLYGPMFAAKTYELPSKEPGTAFGQSITNAFAGAMTGAIEQGTAANWNVNRARAVVQNARTIVDGRTAKDIIIIARSERKKALENALSTYRDQLAKAKSGLNDTRAEMEAAQKARDEQKVLLTRVEITKPIFAYRTSSFTEEPMISFTIANKGATAIKRIFVHGTLQTPGRAVPWVDADFNYAFPGGLEPKETQALSLAPNMFSEWGKVPREAVKGAILSLTLVSIEDPTGKRLGEDTVERGRLEGRKRALEDGIQTLESKITELEAQISHAD